MMCGLSKEQISCLKTLSNSLKIEMGTLIYYFECHLNNITPDVLHQDLYAAFLSHINQKKSEIIITKASGAILKEIANKFMDKSFFKTLPNTLDMYKEDKFTGILLHLFLSLFPTSDAEKNTAWSNCFNATWDNVTLRRISTGTIKKFKTVLKNKDIGLFIFGTFLFIVQSYNADKNKYFIKNIENYFNEYEHWYELAKEKIFTIGLTQNTNYQATQQNTGNFISI